MNPIANDLELPLHGAAGVQLAIALINLALVRMMKWKPELDRLSSLARQVFMVHLWFISITLTIFGVLTWRFARDIAFGEQPLAAWLAAAIGMFWGIRTVLQVAYYSSSHWRGQVGRTLIHVGCVLFCGSLTATYLLAAFGRS